MSGSEMNILNYKASTLIAKNVTFFIFYAVHIDDIQHRNEEQKCCIESIVAVPILEV